MVDEIQDFTGAYQAEALSEDLQLTDHEIIAALRALRFQTPLLKKDQALEVLAAIRQNSARAR